MAIAQEGKLTITFGADLPAQQAPGNDVPKIGRHLGDMCDGSARDLEVAKAEAMEQRVQRM